MRIIDTGATPHVTPRYTKKGVVYIFNQGNTERKVEMGYLKTFHKSFLNMY